ncbi:MAG: hypothetical protein RDU20_07405 [Desulfomonilaceae bacterium]|nr:hypothetical protein [Desulfomonilaceae bacterium]
MTKKIAALTICFVVAFTPTAALTQASGNSSDSSYWSNLVHQENSLVSSVLLLPYLAALIPVRLIDGILCPKPTSQSTIPPAAHRTHH